MCANEPISTDSMRQKPYNKPNRINNKNLGRFSFTICFHFVKMTIPYNIIVFSLDRCLLSFSFFSMFCLLNMYIPIFGFDCVYFRFSNIIIIHSLSKIVIIRLETQCYILGYIGFLLDWFCHTYSHIEIERFVCELGSKYRFWYIF